MSVTAVVMETSFMDGPAGDGADGHGHARRPQDTLLGGGLQGE